MKQTYISSMWVSSAHTQEVIMSTHRLNHTPLIPTWNIYYSLGDMY